VCDLETSGIGAPYIYDISNLRVKGFIKECDKKENAEVTVAAVTSCSKRRV
jgi:hypothetical protein